MDTFYTEEIACYLCELSLYLDLLLEYQHFVNIAIHFIRARNSLIILILICFFEGFDLYTIFKNVIEDIRRTERMQEI